MKNQVKIFLILVLLICFISSCDNTDCSLILHPEYDSLYLQIKDEVTQQHLFFGDSSKYNLEEFQVFISENDSLISYNHWGTENQAENTFWISSTHKGGEPKVTTNTFYVKTPNSPLDTFVLNYKTANYGECYGNLITNSDIYYNGILQCNCTFGDKILIYK